ncbi:SH3 domain-containing protein [Xanthomonas sp. 60]
MVEAGGRGVVLSLRRGPALLIAATLCSGSVQAQDGSGLRFEVVPGTVIRARSTAGGGIEVQRGAAGPAQWLAGPTDADESVPRLSAEDVDFDGVPELVARASVGQVNEVVTVHRFDPATAAFAAWPAPSSPHANCEGFWSLAVDVTTRSLASACRSGPMWYTDVYRVSGGRPYLYRAEHVLMLDPQALAQVLAIAHPDGDSGPLAVWSTYAANGDVLESALGPGLDVPVSGAPLVPLRAQVVPARLPLHAAPGDTRTRRYLVAGDEVAVLDERDGWLQVRYQNPRRGPVLGWIEVTLP